MPHPFIGLVVLGIVVCCWVMGLWMFVFGGGVRVLVDLIDGAGEANPTSGSDRVFSEGLLT